MIRPVASAVIEQGTTTNRVRVRKRAAKPSSLPGYVSPRGSRASEADPTVAVCISLKASELAQLDAKAKRAGVARSKWIALVVIGVAK